MRKVTQIVLGLLLGFSIQVACSLSVRPSAHPNPASDPHDTQELVLAHVQPAANRTERYLAEIAFETKSLKPGQQWGGGYHQPRYERYSCSIGKNGMSAHKKEGDGMTPVGKFRLLKMYYRPDRVKPPSFVSSQDTSNGTTSTPESAPSNMLPWIPLQPDDAWCDDPNSPLYNQHVKLPFNGSHEALWRADRLYDYIGVLDYNIRPNTTKGLGSAIFFHVRSGENPTAGCIAVDREVMDRIAPALTLDTVFWVDSNPVQPVGQ